MGYFPFFIEIGGKKCVVAGGGAAALRRINTLVKFGPQITVIAPAIMSEISSMDGVTCIARPFEDSDIEGAFMVVAATDDLLTNMRIAELCKEKNIPAEAVGSPCFARAKPSSEQIEDFPVPPLPEVTAMILDIIAPFSAFLI